MTSKPFDLDEFGLTLRQLTRLGEREVVVHGHFYGPIERGDFMKVPPQERRRRMAAKGQKDLAMVRRSWSAARVSPRGPIDAPVGFVARFAAADASTLCDVPNAFLIVRSIQGVRKPKPRHRRKRVLDWYTVRARVAIQVEGKSRGSQIVEDRFVMLKAFSRDDAIRRLAPEWKSYARPSINHRGEMFRWQLEEIVDVYHILEPGPIDPKGTEVFSSLRYRRLTPERVWRPKYLQAK